MSAAEIVADLSRLGIKLWVESDQLRFKAPQGVLTPELRTKLVEQKSDLLAFLRQVQASVQSSAAPPISRAARQGELPLSYAQERLWFVDQWEPGSAAYNVYDAILIEGNVDLASLERSLNEIVRRHEVLRTTFAVRDGQPSQRIADSLALTVPLINLEHYEGGDRDAELQRQVNAETSRPFDLSAGPLIRVVLFRLGRERHVLLFNLHHIVSDGWTTGLLIKEMAALYDAFTGGRTSPLPELRIQYADFAAWQREWMKGERLESERAFWKEQLDAAPTSIELPTDRPRPHVRTSRGATHELSLPPALSAGVRRLAQQERVTPYVVLLSAWAALLWKYAGQDEIVIGSPHANRNRTEVEDLVGFFVNTLVLRADLSGDPTFLEMLGRLRDVTLSAQAHQDLPFEKLVEELHLERDLSRTPLFQVAFVFQNAPSAEMAVPGLTIRRLKLPTETSKFDITLTVTDSEPSMEAEIEYSTDLFDAATVARMAGHFQVLLEAALAHPGRRVSRVPILTSDERRRLLAVSNDADSDFRTGLCIHELFEQQAARAPQALAVTFEGEQLSYADLNALANRLANHLTKQGVGPESLVATCLERSLDMVVAILGILKAGGAYVPLDPAYPKDRLAFMLEDTRAQVLLTQERLLDSLPVNRAKVICLDGDSRAIAGESDLAPNIEVYPDSLAYVIYTSGSTGKPKGALVTHSNVTRLFKATDSWFHFDENDVWTLFHSYAFDFSVWELWGPLLYGGRLVVVPYFVSRTPEAFYELLREQRVTVLNQTPSAFRQLMRAEEAAGDGMPLSLRLVIFGGEALETQSLKPWFDRHGDTEPRLINMYGITETTVHVTYRPVSREDLGSVSASVIGGPIPDLKLYVMDQGLELTPIGVPGEMYVGGAGLARGYLNRPELSAERFIPNPFGREPGDRLYKTGDLARILADGDVEYLGRIDHQVKIRGFRIELGEIEAALARHPCVRDVAVIVREDEPGDKRLVGYVVAQDERGASAEELRQHLKRSLPDYMVPTWILILDEMPLTANGKLDRRALPAPGRVLLEGKDKYVAPRTLVEELLAGIWADVLKVERIGINDSFFDSGGHSLLAIQLLSRVNNVFHTNLALRALFESPTVAGLGEQVEIALASGEEQGIPPVVPASREEALPLSYSQENLWLFEQLSPGTPTYTTCRSGRVWGHLNSMAVEASFNHLLGRHEALRASFRSAEGGPVQVIEAHRDYAMPLVDLSGLSQVDRESEAERLSNEEAQRHIDLTEAPIARARLIRLGPEDNVFVMSIHHAAYDLWSGGIVLEEIELAYLAYAKGEPPELAPLPIQYADFAVWQREWLRGETLERLLAYWKERLEGLSETPMEIPTDRPRQAIEAMSGASVYPSYSKALGDEIKALAHREAVTEFMALLAVFQVLLHRYTEQDDVVVSSVISNRNREELEGSVGFFDNPIVLRADASGDPTFREFLGRVRDVALGAYTNQHLPFELLVRELQPERSSNRMPLIQAGFVFLLNYPAMEREIAGLKVVPYKLHSGKTHLDLELALRQSEQGLVGELEYNSDLFDETTIVRMCEHFEKLLESVVADPDQQISELALLTESETSQLLVEWNEAGRERRTRSCVHELFEDQVQRTPGALALISEDERLTYGELNRRANQLARYLMGIGVGPEVLVGVCMERSVEMMVGLLGILKAGGAYLPMDPKYPEDRLAFMLEDARVSVMLTSNHLLPRLPEWSGHVTRLDSDWDEIARNSDQNPRSGAGGDNLAYVIYTSGSTGNPKGVMIQHESLVSYTNTAAGRYEVAQGDRVLQFCSISFDISGEEIYPCLTRGAALVLRTEAMLDSVRAFLDRCGQWEITLMSLPTAYWHEITASLDTDGILLPPSLRMVVIAGESAMPERVAAWRKHTGGRVRLVNTYGPTEATISVTMCELTGPALTGNGLPDVSIGRIIADAKVHVLNRHLRTIPIVAAGEVHIGGMLLARGYLNRPDLTAEKFIPDPFSVEPGARLYKTGDLARYLPDGNLRFVGRVDQQVKIRGFRIELGEIEAVLIQHPAINQAVVTVWEGGTGAKQLVAYLVPGHGQAPTSGELRDFVTETLPDYMAPSFFITLDAIPLTPNGKVDRRALPEPGTVRAEDKAGHAAPRTLVEEMLAGIWSEVLQVERVGLDDNFFELGGHSLLGMQLVLQVQGAFNVELSLLSVFQTPTLAGLAATIEEALHIGYRTQLPPVERASRELDLPLSYAQQRLWFLDRLEPDNPFYNISGVLRLKGRLDVAALEKGLGEIVRRHESLRTIFVSGDGEPRQRILPPWPVRVEPVDLTTLPVERRQPEAVRLISEDAQSSFDLARGPLFRTQLLRLEEDEHALLLTLHHIISDGWSMTVLVNEFTELYKAFKVGRPAQLPELPIQYADYSAWQRQWLQGEVFETQMSYWKRQLGGTLPVLNLPLDRPRPAVLTYRGRSHEFALPERLAQPLRQMSRQEGVTLFMLMLAAFKALLNRYTGEQDVIVGTPIANRRQVEIDHLIGFFVNTLVLRTDLSGDPCFRDLLKLVREAALGAYANQDVPFEQLVEELQPDRDSSRSPIFQVMFMLEHGGKGDAIELPGLEVSSMEAESGAAKFEITLVVEESDGELAGAIEYNTDLFDEATIIRMAAHYERLLEGFAADPEQRVSEVEMLTESERCQLLGDFNNTAAEYPRHELIHSLFERQAGRTPHQLAATCGGEQISYLQLNRRANQLAHFLRLLDVGPEVRVAILMRRSLDMLVAMLGVLKAGGAYVPLDPAYPKDRLDFMMANCGAPVLLTQSELLGALPDDGTHKICLDADWELIAASDESNPGGAASPENLAYVIYTSGSTGQPKGVAIQHGSAVAMISWARGVFTPEELAGVLASTSICFDLSVFELFVPLSCGGKVILAENALSLPGLGAANEVRLINTVPSAMAELIRIGGVPASVTTVNLAGEPLSGRLVRQLYDLAHVGRVYNLYGPSEDTTYSTYGLMGNGEGEGVTIGGPVANSQVYILERRMRQAPVGVAGELYMGGDGLARGYLNRPDLTAERFIPNPFAGQPGARLYKTGDLARYGTDGNIHFLGRVDYQVKVRGFRIEPAEIEAVLGRHPAVRDSVVLVWEDAPGDKRLVAYVVSDARPGPDAAELRGYLREKLPDYMVPSFYVTLDELPLTPNGKLDRRALPVPERTPAEDEDKYVAPRTLVEEMLAGIWADVLKVERIGVNDSFFDSGGHSLLAIQLLSRINNAFHANLALRVLFESPTVAGLAERLEIALASGQEQEVPAVVPVSREEALPLSYSQENLWLFEQLSPGTPTYTTCRSGRVWGHLNAAAVEASFNHLLGRHEALRTTFTSVDGTPYQIIHDHSHYAMPLVDLSGLSQEGRESEAERLSYEEAQRPIDIARGPVARARLLRLGDEDHAFVMSIHHIAYDLWSGGVVLEEIELAYLAYVKGEPPELAPLPIQYADFAVWQREWLRGEILDKQLAYWRARLEGLSATPMEIPTDRPRPLVETMSGASEYSAYAGALSEGIRTLARREGVTEFMTLLAVFQALLHRYTGQDDVVAGSVIANRNREELEGVVGFFDNTIVLRADASGNPTFREFLGRVRDVALGAYANQYVPFEMLVQELQPERSSNRTPFIQAMFVFLLDNTASEQEFAGLKVVPYELDSGKAMFDLLLAMHETERGLEAELNYNRDLFDAATINRMCEHFEKLLGSAVANPDQRLRDLPMLTEAERSQLLEWNETGRRYDASHCLQHLLEGQVERTPDSVAVVCEEDQITYRDLNARANQLARYLRRLGVGPEIRVGVCLGRSVDMLVAILGVLKAGGAYVPLDPNYPQERLSYMLEDARVPLLLTEQSLREVTPEAPVESSYLSIHLDTAWELIAAEGRDNVEAAGHPDNLAYVIYTSGSTGRPKGVAIAHRSAVAFLNWAHEAFPEDLLGGLLASTSICFDLSVFEIFLPLCFGGRMILAENVLATPELAARQITLINTVPSAMRELQNSGGLPPSVKTVNLAGEPLSADLAHRLYEGNHIEKLYNLYGPSETTTYSTFACIEAGDGGLPTIGGPIANTRVHILDDGFNPVGVGVPGELFIGGDGLARCYLNREEPTAEKFLPDPFASEPGARMYRTGDRARWRSDGKLEFMGRIDQQVKVRGYRIELGEIEAALRCHPSVREAVVVASGEADGDKKLVAYVVAQGESEAGSAELRRFLQQSLPEYMLPNAFIALEEFPLTPSGKLNRKALPAPGVARVAEGPRYLAPRDNVELQLVEMWESLLGVNRVGIRDSFFDLGGYSLLGVRLMARIEREFGRHLPLGLLLQNPTVERLASLLRQEACAVERSALVPINAAGSRLPFFCVHPVGGNVLCYRELARRLGPDQPFYAFQLPESAGDGEFKTIAALASHYLDHLRIVQPEGPYRLGGWSMGGVIALEMSRLLMEQGQRVLLLALIDSYATPPDAAPERIDDLFLLGMFAEDLEGLSGKSLGFSVESFAQAGVAEALELLLDRLRAHDVVPAEFGGAELGDLFKLYRASLSALLSYEPQAYPGYVTLLRATRSATEHNADFTLGWGRHVLGGVDVHEIEGDHYSIMSGESLEQVADLLRAKLGEEGLSAGPE